jgi:hypothetical protein
LGEERRSSWRSAAAHTTAAIRTTTIIMVRSWAAIGPSTASSTTGVTTDITATNIATSVATIFHAVTTSVASATVRAAGRRQGIGRMKFSHRLILFIRPGADSRIAIGHRRIAGPKSGITAR